MRQAPKPKQASRTPHVEVMRKAPMPKHANRTSRLRDEKKPHAEEVRRAQGAEQTRVIGN